MILKNTTRLMILMALAVFTAGCLDSITDSSYRMRFFINETGEPLEGDVFNNGNLLGHAENGNISTNLEKLRPGLIALNGTYNDHPFEFYFEFPKESLDYSGIDFSVKEEDLKSYLFNVSAMEIPGLEREIFDLINKKRMESGTKILRWNDRIAPVAKDYSRTLSIEGFHHKDLEGRNAGDRVKEKNIFYTIVAENLFMLEGIDAAVNISETIVDGWMKSPGHRSPIVDRDELFSDGAVGLYCEKRTCYATMIFAGLEENRNIRLGHGYLTFLYLYDPAFPFDFDVSVSVDIESTEYINIYFVPDREQYENFLQNRPYLTISERKNIRRFSDVILAGPGEGIIIQTTGGKEAEIDVHFRYS